ncbi:MAG: alpha/beta hydrolase [Candidatus Peribacteraceae bacterium]|nr:alpha/beta hydrolase [Candidatus Peribacteraceae bacterium]
MQKTLLCLHGWGGSGASFTELREALAGTGITVLAPDLPGFGGEPEPPEPWDTDAYADWVTAYIRENVKGAYALLGHSHGGRIAIKLAARLAQGRQELPQPTHLFLCAAAGIRHPRHIRRIIGLTLAKAGKSLLSVPGFAPLQAAGKRMLYKILRVHDYENASETMRQTLVRVSQEDLRPLLEHITLPTSIFWGEEDAMTPLSDGRLMHERIKGSTLITFPGIRHRVHRERAEAIGKSVRIALSKDTNA